MSLKSEKIIGDHASVWLLDVSLTKLIAMPITDSWMFRSQIEAFEDFRTISKYTPANPEVKQPDANKQTIKMMSRRSVSMLLQ
jgi:hypothetical protein